MSDELDSKDVATWTDQDVWYWVYENAYDEFAHTLWEHQVDGKALLNMKKEKLNQICVGKDEKISALWQDIKKLKKKPKKFFNKKKPAPLAKDYESGDDSDFSDSDFSDEGSADHEDKMNHSSSSLRDQLDQRLRGGYTAQIQPVDDEDNSELYLDPTSTDEPQDNYEEFDEVPDYPTPTRDTEEEGDPPLPPPRAPVSGFMSADSGPPSMSRRMPVLPPKPQILSPPSLPPPSLPPFVPPSLPQRNVPPDPVEHFSDDNVEEDQYLPPDEPEEQENYEVPDTVIVRKQRMPEPIRKSGPYIIDRPTPPPQKSRLPDLMKRQTKIVPIPVSDGGSVSSRLKKFETSVPKKFPPPLPGQLRIPTKVDPPPTQGGGLWNNILKSGSPISPRPKSPKPNLPIQSPILSPKDPVQPHLPRLPSPRRDPNSLSSCAWYHENIDRVLAQQALKNYAMEGAFVVRKSVRNPNCPYSLSLYYNGTVRNLQIGRRTDNKFALGAEKIGEERFLTVKELIEFHKTHAVVLANNEGRTCLINPVPI